MFGLVQRLTHSTNRQRFVLSSCLLESPNYPYNEKNISIYYHNNKMQYFGHIKLDDSLFSIRCTHRCTSSVKNEKKKGRNETQLSIRPSDKMCREKKIIAKTRLRKKTKKKTNEENTSAKPRNENESATRMSSSGRLHVKIVTSSVPIPWHIRRICDSDVLAARFSILTVFIFVSTTLAFTCPVGFCRTTR